MKDVTELCETLGGECAAEVISKATKVIQFQPEQPANQQTARPLPPITSVKDLFQTVPALPEEVIHGLLHRGSKMVLGGGSKSYKTWCLMDLAISVSAGLPWWKQETTQGPVLYINFEIQDAFFRERLDGIAAAKTTGLEQNDNLDVWNLRGYCADLSKLMPQILERIKTTARFYSLIVVDPIYKGLGGRDENSAGDIGQLLNEIEILAMEADAAVVFGAHFSKGNQASKESIDRISGSGVFGRDPDTILVMTRHESEDSYTVEATLRNFKPIEPFCVSWEYPLMVRNGELDPVKLKKPGAVTKYSTDQLLEVLADQELTTGDWMAKTCEKTGMSKRTFADKKKELVEDGEVIEMEGGKWKAA